MQDEEVRDKYKGRFNVWSEKRPSRTDSTPLVPTVVAPKLASRESSIPPSSEITVPDVFHKDRIQEDLARFANTPGLFKKYVAIARHRFTKSGEKAILEQWIALYEAGNRLADAKIQLGRLSTTPTFMAIKWNNPDSILQASAFAAQATTTTGGLQVPGEGPGCAKGSGLPTVPPCAFSANGMTNATYNDPNGKPHFFSQFLYADFILNNQIRTSSDRFPINLLLEYENNLDAKDHPLAPTGNGVVLTGLGKQSHTYLADISVGQTKSKNDFQIGYAWLREEQDAAIASFAESDQRAPTNILQNRWYALWKLRANTVASYTFWYGRTLNSNLQHAILATGITPGQQEPYLKRMQFDLIYSF